MSSIPIPSSVVKTDFKYALRFSFNNFLNIFDIGICIDSF